MYEVGQPKNRWPYQINKSLNSSTEELVKATGLLKNIRANQIAILEATNRILRYEIEGDTVYRKEMTALFKTEKDAISPYKMERHSSMFRRYT